VDLLLYLRTHSIK